MLQESFILSHLTLRHSVVVERYIDPQKEATSGRGETQFELAPIGSHPEPFLYHQQTNLIELFPSSPPAPCLPCYWASSAATVSRVNCSVYIWGSGQYNWTDETRAIVAAANAAAVAAMTDVPPVREGTNTLITVVGEDTGLLSAVSTYDSIL